MAWYRDYYPPSRPIAAEGGIKSRSRRGAFARQWWAQRWLAVLESLNLGGRLQRGRSYARRGQVLDISIAPEEVTAEVQGSRPRPYAVRIGVKKLPAKATKHLAAELAKSPYCLAKLMIREMPQDIEAVFEAARVSLFPGSASELHTECSCPDWSNPCKHIAAVYYLLGEEFDRDPFLMFRLRGIDTAALLDAVGASESASATSLEEEPVAGEALHRGAAAPESFWEGTRADVDLIADPPPRPAPLLRLLGNLPFWRGASPLEESLAPLYARATRSALELLAG